VTSKKTVSRQPAPGRGFTTVTEAEPALAVSETEAGMLAVRRELLTKVITRLLPFHLTTDPRLTTG
jgi:hypothetical protein